jgi:hypothetical protein
MHHTLVDRIGCFVWKNTCGETRDNFLNAGLIAGVKNVVIDEHVLAEEVKIGPHVVEESANLNIGKKSVADKGLNHGQL